MPGLDSFAAVLLLAHLPSCCRITELAAQSETIRIARNDLRAFELRLGHCPCFQLPARDPPVLLSPCLIGAPWQTDCSSVRKSVQ
ncbi:hypothetical protein B0T22DRAFT_242456 [Podospora appendiculata]|uniref:Secreted protein n=1 Tax=Podospora appendiculata TaxID=314037 RepID=A0AAE0X6T4_9PEZI|nr:hypothetical protein B0T22DRAFT_242456 [Podospora appendiculata]